MAGPGKAGLGGTRGRGKRTPQLSAGSLASKDMKAMSSKKGTKGAGPAGASKSPRLTSSKTPDKGGSGQKWVVHPPQLPHLQCHPMFHQAPYPRAITCGGRLKHFWRTWADAGASPWVVGVLRESYKIPFIKAKPPFLAASCTSLWLGRQEENIGVVEIQVLDTTAGSC